MKRYIYFRIPTLSAIFLLTALACTKTNTSVTTITLPALSTDSLVKVTATTAETGGIILSNGNASITARGVCWSTSEYPNITNNKTADSIGLGNFISNLTGLAASTKYYARAYATNSIGTAYGNEISFITEPTVATIPLLTTEKVFDVTDTSAKSEGSVISDEGAPIITEGACWDTAINPTIANNFTTQGIGIGDFSGNINGLTPNTTYYLRAYATNSRGTGYGNTITFKTKVERDSTKVFAVTEATLITNKSMTVATADFSQPGTLDMELDNREDSNIIISFQSKDNNPVITKKDGTDFSYAYSDAYKGTQTLKDADTLKYAGWTVTGLNKKKYGFNRIKFIAVSNKTNQIILLHVSDLKDNEDSLITNQFYNDAIAKNLYSVIKFQF